MNEELKKITAEMYNFSKKYNCLIKVERIKVRNLETEEVSYIYDLKTEEEEK